MVTETAPALELHDLSVRYGEAPPVVHGIDLAVADGEIVALLGASGSGKSTLLRAIAGLEPVASGHIRMHGRPVANVPTHLRGCGMVFQDGQLFPHRTVAGNIAYGLEAQGMPARDRRARVAEMLELVDLADYEERGIDALSGGQAQRVALARALTPAPEILLLDEPLSALDRALREHLAGELRRIIREAGATAIHVTHDHDEAFTVADRVAVLIDGELAQVDRGEVLLHEPATEAVAEFFRGRGTVRARIVGRDAEETLVALDEADLARAAGDERRATLGEPGDEITLRLR